MKSAFPLFIYVAILLHVTTTSENISHKGLSSARTPPSGHINSTIRHQRQKRQDVEPFLRDYPEPFEYNDYPEPNPNLVVPAGIAGGTGLLLKAAKTKAKLKGLKLLAIPAGIALIAALASGVIPPAVVGGINLPFQGKRRKRQTDEDLMMKIPMLFEKSFPKKFEMLQQMLQKEDSL